MKDGDESVDFSPLVCLCCGDQRHFSANNGTDEFTNFGSYVATQRNSECVSKWDSKCDSKRVSKCGTNCRSIDCSVHCANSHSDCANIDPYEQTNNGTFFSAIFTAVGATFTTTNQQPHVPTELPTILSTNLAPNFANIGAYGESNHSTFTSTNHAAILSAYSPTDRATVLLPLWPTLGTTKFSAKLGALLAADLSSIRPTD
jgi:hypothetical protein